MWRVVSTCSLLILLAAGCRTPAVQTAPLFAGTASIDITPDWPVALGGYGGRMGRLSKGVHDRIFAKALYLEAGGCRVVIVTTDLLGSLLPLRNDVRRDLPGDLNVILAASHTHSAPAALVDTNDAILNFTVGKFDRKLYDWYRERLLLVIRQAVDERAPATFSAASIDAPEFCRNRRSKNYAEGQAPVDPTLGVALIGNALLLNYAAHGTVVGEDNWRISGDWPGALQRQLEAAGRTVLYTNGAEGNISPVTGGGTDDFDKCQRMGAALAERVRSVQLPPAMDRLSLVYAEREVQLPQPSFRWRTRSVLGVLAMGDVALICFPGELAAELGLELKHRYLQMGFRQVWIVGLANDHLFYALSLDQYEKGGYERTMSFYGPSFGPWIVDQFTELGRTIPNRNSRQN